MSESMEAYPTIRIGKYLLVQCPRWIWISVDGEGGGFDEAKLEAVIDKFYEEHF
jgi:hypothetical protein